MEKDFEHENNVSIIYYNSSATHIAHNQLVIGVCSYLCVSHF